MLSGFSVFHPPGQTKFSRPKQKSTPSPSRVPLSLSVIQLCSNYAYLLRRPRSYNVSAGCVEMGKSQISRGTGRPELESLANIYFPFKSVFCSPDSLSRLPMLFHIHVGDKKRDDRGTNLEFRIMRRVWFPSFGLSDNNCSICLRALKCCSKLCRCKAVAF